VAFKVWAPASSTVEVVFEDQKPGSSVRLAPAAAGYFASTIEGLGAGLRYAYRLDGEGPFPDPASRSQPDGVHGTSAVVDPSGFPWSDDTWQGVPLERLVIYELHVGTFTPAGTFAAAAERLDDLRALGITAIELMPVAAFPGSRNWGYDGVSLFAPARCYGTPDDLRRLVDRAHGLGLAVILDVVYNHTGPDGSYLRRFSPYVYSTRHQSPWGDGINFDGDHSGGVRDFVIENALHWVHEYHLDGLRLDATHAIADDSPQHILAELTARVKTSTRGRHVHVFAEDHRNLTSIVAPPPKGWGLDGVWADDFHHQMRRRLAGDTDGYYQDYSGSSQDIATTIRQGWFFTGQPSAFLGTARGTDPSGLSPARFVVCLQNHDQIGNRAFGERLNHQVDTARCRAASVLLLMLPHTPLIFMGQEWGASSPFRYFTDHEPGLGALVTEGRRQEFRTFAAFADPASVARIPDPQAFDTFAVSRLDWDERTGDGHAAMLQLFRDCLALRADLRADDGHDAASAVALDEDTVAFGRTHQDGRRLIVVARLTTGGDVSLRNVPLLADSTDWIAILTSDDPGQPMIVERAGNPFLRFRGPATVVLAPASPGRSR